MCHRIDESLSPEELHERHRSDEAGELRDDTPDVDAFDESAGNREDIEPPAEPRAPADD